MNRFKKILSISLAVLLIFSMVSPSYAIVDWIRGDGTDAVKGTDNASDIDYDVTNYIQDPLDRLLIGYVYGCTLTYASASTVTVGIGEVTCSNGAGTIKRMRQNTATATLDMTSVGVGGIDSGSHAGAEQVSTWYDVYAVADADATTFTVICAEQGVALSDVTYYQYIGSIYNDAGSDIKKFYCSGYGSTVYYQWDATVSVTTVVSAGAWSGAISCSAAMPSSSTCAVFGAYIYSTVGGGASSCVIRPHGGTGSTGVADGAYDSINSGSLQGGAASEITTMTDSSQQINHYDGANNSAVTIVVKGFYLNR